MIKLGYEVKTGERVDIDLSHLIVTGVTQASGKTTTLEALIRRSGLKAVVFKTKVGEESFSSGRKISPYYREKFDWEYALELLRASMKESLKIERSFIIKYSRIARNLREFKGVIDQALEGEKLNQFEKSILITLQAYLEKILPQLQHNSLSGELDLKEGLNIMDLRHLDQDVQSLIIESVLDKVLNEFKDTIVVIPEAWKFSPQKYSNPCKRTIESFIRQGASNNNYIWIDSQEMAGVDKTPLKQVATWCLGYQSEKNEVKHTLDQIPSPTSMKPKPDEIMTLDRGHFILASRNQVKTVYVQPAWLSDEQAKRVAKGEIDVNEVYQDVELEPIAIEEEEPEPQDNRPVETSSNNGLERVEKEVSDLGERVSIIEEKTSTLTDQVSKSNDYLQFLTNELEKVKKDNESKNCGHSISIEEIVEQVMNKLPESAVQQPVYQVSPLEKIRKDFLQEAKDYVISIVRGLDEDQVRIIKWVEQNGKMTTKREIFKNCFGEKATGGQRYTRLSEKVDEMAKLGVIKMDSKKRIRLGLKNKIILHLSTYDAGDDEVQQVYDHILVDLIGED